MKNILGVAVIGQSPRPDCEELFKRGLNAEDEVIVMGALDGLPDEEVHDFKPEPGEKILIALDRQLAPITVPDKLVMSRMQAVVTELERAGATMILINCSGRMQKFEASVPVLLPGDILEHTILAVAEGKKVGVLVPDEAQIDGTFLQFEELNTLPFVLSASPFGPREKVTEALEKLKGYDPALIVMDCTSYDRTMKDLAREITGKPVITAESILLKILAELSGKQEK